MWGEKVIEGRDLFVFVSSKVSEAACGGWYRGNDLNLSLWGEFRLSFRGDESDLSFWEDFRPSFRAGDLDWLFWEDFRPSFRGSVGGPV